MAEMTSAQFEVVAELLRSREPVRSAVRKVILEDFTAKEAAITTGLIHQSVTNALRRYRNAHAKLRVAYCDA